MKPQTTTRPWRFMRFTTSCMISPPTFSKSMSMPLGVAAASFSFQSACLRSEAANNNAAVEIHAVHDFLHDFSANIFKIDVDAVGSGGGELFFPVRVLAIGSRKQQRGRGDSCGSRLPA